MSGGPAPTDGPVSPRQRRMVFAGLMLATSLPAFDLLILSTAGKDILDDLGGELIWMFIAYHITLVASMPLYGKLGDLYGRKRTFQTAIVMFIVSSMIAGLAVNPAMLIVGRALQGVAGGGITGQGQAVIGDIVSPRERGRYAWLVPTVYAVASMLGPFLGGFFVDNLSWRWIFFVNAPAGAVAFVLIGIAFRVPTPRVEHRLDFLGAGLLVGAVTLLSFVASTAGESYSWDSPIVFVAGGFGALLAIGLVLQERRAPEPVFPLHLLRDRIVAVSAGTTFFIGAANFGMAVFLPIFLQVVCGLSATRAGLALLPVSAGITLSSWLVGRSVTRSGRYRWYPVTGVAIFGVGVYLLSTIQQDTAWWMVWIYTFLAGVGSGTASPVIMIAMQNAVQYRDLGVVSSLGMFGRTIGQVFGPAFGATLMAVRFESHLDRLVDGASRASLDAKELRTETKTIDDLPEPVRDQVVEAFRLAVNDTFRLATVFCIAGLVVAAFMKTRPLRASVQTDGGDQVDSECEEMPRTMSSSASMTSVPPADSSRRA
jgi:EmrB/QacA subfamily drug resistance transporter